MEKHQPQEASPGIADPNPKEGPPAPSRPSHGCPWWCVVLVALAVSTAAVWTYDRYYATKIVAVDLKGFLADQKQLLITGAITEDQLKKNLDALEAAVDAIPERTAVVLGDVVVRHVEIIKP